MTQHGRGEGSKYTAKRRSLELIWIADFQTRAEAFELERRLHGWSRAKKEALMRGDFEALPGLSLNLEAREARALALRQAQGERSGDPPLS
jgi:predicted GIY-YIG superfamily endonuclease